MGSQQPQMNEWSTTQTNLSRRQDLLKTTNKNKIIPYDTYTADVNQHQSNDQENR
ncbi:unnamed protein product, partial [Rotaria sp. Silwood1]